MNVAEVEIRYLLPKSLFYQGVSWIFCPSRIFFSTEGRAHASEWETRIPCDLLDFPLLLPEAEV